MPQDNFYRRNGQLYITDWTTGPRKAKEIQIKQNDWRNIFPLVLRFEAAGRRDIADELMEMIDLDSCHIGT
jgi:hypothetical protein